MEKQHSLKITLELLWWAVTAVVAWAVLQPIHNATNVWPFEVWNVIFVVVLLTLTTLSTLAAQAPSLPAKPVPGEGAAGAGWRSAAVR